MLNINGTTKTLAIIGNPVSHSHSPQMHNFLSERYNNNYVYLPFNVLSENLESAVDGIRALDISGVNVTAPHKFNILKYLDEFSDNAKKFGSVNTVVNRNGKLFGYNTDAEGFYKSLLHEGTEIEGRDILIIGAGGATQPIAVLFAIRGAGSITILNRTKAHAERLAAYVKDITGYNINIGLTMPHYDIVINTTSVGMHPNTEKCPINDFSFIDNHTTAADMIYNPAKTIFLQNSEKNGAKIINGLGMLIYQGIMAYELFTDTKLPDDAFDIVKKEVFKI